MRFAEELIERNKKISAEVGSRIIFINRGSASLDGALKGYYLSKLIQTH